MPRSTEDKFCRKCGFNFKQAREPESRPLAAGAQERRRHSLIPAAFVKTSQRHDYRITPELWIVRAIAMLVFMLLLAGGALKIVTWANLNAKTFFIKIRHSPSLLWQHWLTQPKLVEPDWEARGRYWHEYYLNVFSPPSSGTLVNIYLVNGLSLEGIFLRIEDDHVILKRAAHELGYARSLLAGASRGIFFAHDFAMAAAAAKLAEEKIAWQKELARSIKEE